MNPGGMRRYNAVRLTLTPTREAAEDGANQGRGTATTAPATAKRPDSTMTRLEFSRAVLQKGMGFVPAELNCLAKPPGPVETFEVSFKNPQLLEKFWKIFNSSRSSPLYNKFKAYPLSDTESKVVTVNFHNECIQEYDIETWLNRYATIKSEGRRVLDDDQVWTGGLKWLVQLKPDPTGVGGVRHQPSTITLGNNRGSVHYYGMPKLCRNCGNLGHLAAWLPPHQRIHVQAAHCTDSELPPGCKTVENTYHVLAECSVARRVWALFVPSVSHNRLLTLPRLTTENILNCPPGGCTPTELRQQWRIIGVVKQVLWETRKIKVFNRTTVDPTTLRRITILLRDHAITDFHKDPVTARAAWGHPSTGGGVEEGPTLDLHPERRFTGEYHNDPRVGARPVDCSAPQVVLPPLCRSSTSRGPRHTAPPTASERQMERAAHRRVPLMTFGSGLPCGPARSPIVFPSLQAQHHPSTQKRRGGGTHIRPSHRAGCSQVQHQTLIPAHNTISRTSTEQ
ncbi:hypothetical protein DPEC_G00096530 [Dallia pectoralis]|uniref:Uncharacterized protein n=1 Tax=Dallia pectoralis TaxID=75939 RepID=A0ACC2GVI6_DALPE|nr:hypothetical protein DPEC_G00096530 [Dallia pectoralis]